MVHGAAALAQVQHGGQRPGQVGFGALHRLGQAEAFGQVGGNGAGQGAAGAVGVGVGDPPARKPVQPAPGVQQVVGVLHAVAALEQHRAAVPLADPAGSLFHGGPAVDGHARQKLGLGDVGGGHQGHGQQDAPEEEFAAPVYLELGEDWQRHAVIYWNGRAVGRYADVGPDRKFHLVREWIKPEGNCLEILLDGYSGAAQPGSVHFGVYQLQRKLKLELILSDKLDDSNVADALGNLQGVIIAPGFGPRGMEGKLAALKYAREHNMPCLGICLGMQAMCIEFARNVLGYADANSTEIDSTTTHNVVDIMDEQKNVLNLGGSMRLGAYKCHLKKGSKVYEIYGKEQISERHRHRFEFNNAYKEEFERNGMSCSGINEESNLVEIIEYTPNRWFIGVQFHPEYSSTVVNPHPLFVSFVKAAIG